MNIWCNIKLCVHILMSNTNYIPGLIVCLMIYIPDSLRSNGKITFCRGIKTLMQTSVPTNDRIVSDQR